MTEPDGTWARRRGKFRRSVSVAGIVLGSTFLALTAAFIAWEGTWVEDRHYGGREAFLYGAIGTEIVPLAVLRALPKIAPEAFQPGGEQAGDWIDQFGFLRRSDGDPYADLPLGMTVSRYRPLSGAPSPIPFVGIGCSTCHTSELHHDSLGEPLRLEGAGNSALDLIAWTAALEAALLAKGTDNEWLLTVDGVAETMDEGLPWLPDRAFIWLWLRAARAGAESMARIYDEKEPGAFLRDSRRAPQGPIRTTPFMSLTRRLLNRPGTPEAYSKIPVVYHQGWKNWAQFDGSIASPEVRSVLAAMTVSATRHNIMQPEIGRNIVSAARYLLALDGPSYAEVFPQGVPPVDGESLSNGRKVYERHCAGCHGSPTPDGGWAHDEGSAFGKVIPLGEIGTDPQRVAFRHSTRLPRAIVEHMSFFPVGHIFRVEPDEIRPNPEDLESFVPGYLAGPIDSIFARAPYLHNASVLTLAELINLVPRNTAFCRGAADYDSENLGLLYVAPEEDADGELYCEPEGRHYFLFDTARKGNSARGHDYPWRYPDDEEWNAHDLQDLLAYLKRL